MQKHGFDFNQNNKYINHKNVNKPWLFAYDNINYKFGKPKRTLNIFQNSLYIDFYFEINNVILNNVLCPNWPNTESYKRRRKFCNENDSFFQYCDCNNYLPIDFVLKPFSNNNLKDINTSLKNTPIAIIGSHRPNYLIKCLESLLKINGTDPNNIHVFIDQKNSKMINIIKLFNLNYTVKKNGCKSTCAIQNNYKNSLLKVFELFPKAEEVIIIEEDLEIASDFMLFMAQTIPFLRNDPNLYCVSAWNDQVTLIYIF